MDPMAASPMELTSARFAFLCDAIGFVRRSGKNLDPATRRSVRRISRFDLLPIAQEAACASSRREFIRFNEIALRSANECVCGCELFTATEVGNVQRPILLLEEARQLARFLRAIVLSDQDEAPTFAFFGLYF